MTTGGILVLLLLLGCGALAGTTVGVAVRGGRGPADPPASHLRVDPAGFPVPPAPRGALGSRRRVAAAPPSPAPRSAWIRSDEPRASSAVGVGG